VNQQPSALRILCLRHGKTDYTGQPKDLTPEGERHIREVAYELRVSWIYKYIIDLSQLAIVSSGAPRAQYTAEVVAQVLGHQAPLILRDELQPMIWRDPSRAAAACNGLSGKGYIDYETEPVFADPAVFETPAEVRARWYAFLSEYISSAFEGKAAQSTILVSHYELFCNVVNDIFGIAPSESSALRHGEPISFSVYPTDHKERVLLYGLFRDKCAIVDFDLSSLVITPS
jgi:broad specificity phosphatase PhoE